MCKGANDTEVTLKWRTPPHFCARESCPCPTLVVDDSQQLIWRAMVKLLRTAWCLWSSPSSVSPPQVVAGYSTGIPCISLAFEDAGDRTIPVKNPVIHDLITLVI